MSSRRERASARKLASARANGAKSHGPITTQGRQNSARANFKHGLTANTVSLSNEDQPAFLEMIQEYTDHFQPVGPVETDLIEAMVVAKWQERRMWTIQTATLDHRMDTQQSELDAKCQSLDQPTRLAIAFITESGESRSLALQLRYANSHRRAYEKSLDILVKLQADRVAHGSSLGDPPKAVADAAQTSDPPFSNEPNEPNPKIEHSPSPTPLEPKLCECGRLTSPKWNRCDCGRVLRRSEKENE